MGLIGAALELGVELDAHIEGAVPQLHGFHDVTIGRGAADGQAGVHQGLAEVVVEFIAVAMALIDVGRAVSLKHLRAGDT